MATVDILDASLATVPIEKPNANGQADMAGSRPVVIASNQSAVPVSGPLTDTELRATAVPVSGSVTATGPLTDTELRATAVPVSGPLTDTQLRATAVPVSGTVTATGPLTDTELRATAVPVSGTVTATGPLTDTELRATAVPVSGPLTDTELRATAVPVSGPLTDTQLRATAVPVSGTVALGSGSAVIGKTGYKLVKVTANFTRPADITAYAVGDAVTNSTSAPTVFQLDLGALGAVNGQAIEIRKLVVVSSAKQATLPLLNVFLSDATFTATNDNSALDIADTTMEAGGAWFVCDVQAYTASNSRVAHLGCTAPMILAAADTKLYGTIQAANAYTPVSGEKFTIVAWVALL